MCNTLTAVGCNPYQLPVYNGETFAPVLLVQVHASDVSTDPTEHRDEHAQSFLNKAASENSAANAESFGIVGTVPDQNAAFSGGLQHQTLVNHMHIYSTVSFYSEIERRYVVYAGTLKHKQQGNWTLTKDFADAVASLPDSAAADDDAAKWFAFFEKFGTHYVNGVSMGGAMKMTTFLQSSIESDSKVSQSHWSFDLEASFQIKAGINVSWDSEHTQEEYEQFENYQEDPPDLVQVFCFPGIWSIFGLCNVFLHVWGPRKSF